MKNFFSVEGKTALITGGSRGIGLMIAKAYVRSGAKVYISSRNNEVCEKVAVELSKEGKLQNILQMFLGRLNKRLFMFTISYQNTI